MIPLLVAHRGYMEKYPENSLSALRAALEAGACLIEFDIQMDAAGQLVVLHDDNLKRTGNSTRSVFELQDYAGISVHEPARLGDSFKPEPVPGLVQAIALLMQYPASTAFVEIKQESLRRWGMERVVDDVLGCIERAKAQCVIISDELEALLYARDKGGCPIGWVIHGYDDAHRAQADEHVPDFMICNYKRINAELWQGSWQWMLYDISDPELALEWAQKGAGLIETRDIGGMLQHALLGQRACRQHPDESQR
jgi:glycerophosphoryl diester phosphodiesterase